MMRGGSYIYRSLPALAVFGMLCFWWAPTGCGGGGGTSTPTTLLPEDPRTVSATGANGEAIQLTADSSTDNQNIVYNVTGANSDKVAGQLIIPRSEYSDLILSQSTDGSYQLVRALTGETMPAKFFITETPGNTAKEKVYDVTFIDERDGKTYRFTAMNDPLPVVVVVAGIAAALCGAVILAEEGACLVECLATTCPPGTARRCAQSVTFGFNWTTKQFGCSANCSVECKKTHDQGSIGP